MTLIWILLIIKKKYKFTFQNGHPTTEIFFGNNTTIKEVRKQIGKNYDLKNVKLVINALKVNDNDNDLLINVNKNNSPIMVIGEQICKLFFRYYFINDYHSIFYINYDFINGYK